MKKAIILAVCSLTLIVSTFANAEVVKKVTTHKTQTGHVKKVVKHDRYGDKIVKKTKCSYGNCKTVKKVK